MVKKDKKQKLTPIEAVEFLESFRLMMADKDEPAKSISIRIPENILRALKLKAKSEGKKYQSLIVEILRKSLKA
jgi:predicted DNA binding CopG/RHH family protein